MLRTNLILMSVFLFLPLNEAHTQSEGWQTLRTDEDYIYYINPKSIARTAQNTYKVWLKLVVAETNKRELNKKVWWAWDYMLQLQEYDCAQRRTLLVEIVGYDAKGNPIEHLSYRDKKSAEDWKDVIPSSTGELCLNPSVRNVRNLLARNRSNG